MAGRLCRRPVERARAPRDVASPPTCCTCRKALTCMPGCGRRRRPARPGTRPRRTISMSKLRVACSGSRPTASAPGPTRSLGDPLGVQQIGMHKWCIPTRTFQAMLGSAGGLDRASTTSSPPPARQMSAPGSSAAICSAGARAMARRPGRAGGGPGRRTRAPVFVLTAPPARADPDERGTPLLFRRRRDSRRARPSATRRRRIGSHSVARCHEFIRQYMPARLIDEMHLALTPAFCSAAARRCSGGSTLGLGYE